MTLPWQPGHPLTIPAREARLEARCWGPAPADAPTLVLLHEGLGCVQLWRDFPERLTAATGCGVLAWSRQGYGQSSPCALPRPLDYMTAEALGPLPAVLDAFALGDVCLIGHSDGASIANIYIGACADPRIRSAILMAPHVFTEDITLSAIAAAREAFATGDLRQRLARYHADPDCAFRGWCDAWLDPGFADWDITDGLPGIQVPVLAFQGADDPYGTPRQLEAYARLCPGPVETALLPGCGHAPHLESPDATLDLITGFLQRTGA